MPRGERSNSLTPSVRSTVATCCEMPDWVAFSRSAARVNDPSSHTAMTARTWRSAMLATQYPLSRKLMSRRAIYYFGERARKARIRRQQKRAGRTHGNGKFRHRRIGLAAARQLGPDEEVPDRAGARNDEKAWPRRHALHVRRERTLPYGYAHAGLEPAQAGPALRDAVRRR